MANTVKKKTAYRLVGNDLLRTVNLHEEIYPKLRALDPTSFCSIISGMVHFWCRDYGIDELWLMDVMKTSLADRQHSKS